MTEKKPAPQPPEIDHALRELIFQRAKEINGKILTRLAIVSDELDGNNHLGAIGGLDGLEPEVQTLRSVLLLLR